MVDDSKLDATLKRALAKPEQAIRELELALCPDSFEFFVERAWPIIEPAVPLVTGRPLHLICKSLQAITEGKVTRLVINVPPGFSKSTLVNVLWPAWEWGPRGHYHHRFISACYEQGLAIRDLLRCRDLLLSEWYQARWPFKFKDDQNQKTYYENTKTGWRLATSVGGALTGYRGDRIIVDDPHDVKRAESEIERDIALRWWTETIPTRLNHANSAIVLVMQRLHVSDLSGHTIAKMGPSWKKLILPMEFEPARRAEIPEIDVSDDRIEPGELLWPERFAKAAVDDLKQALMSRGGSYAVAGQLQQRPVPASGGMLNRAAVQYTDSAPEGGITVRGWDLAATHGSGCYTAGVKLRYVRERLYVLDVVRLRGSPLEVEDAILAAARQDGPGCQISIPQDPGQAGKAQKAHLAAKLGGYPVHFSTEYGSKPERARAIAAQWEAGNVFLVRAPWNDTLVAEAEMFPASDDMDQIDALARAYGHILSNMSSGIATISGMCWSESGRN